MNGVRHHEDRDMATETTYIIRKVSVEEDAKCMETFGGLATVDLTELYILYLFDL